MQRLLKFGIVASVALAALGCTSTTPPSVTAGNNQGPSATSSNPSEAPKDSSPKKDSKPSEQSSSPSDEKLLEAAMLNEADVAADGTWTITAKGDDPHTPEPDAPLHCPFLRDSYDGSTLLASSPEFSKGDSVIQVFALAYKTESDAKAAMEVRRKGQQEECLRKSTEASFASQGNVVVKITSDPLDGSGLADEEIWTAINFTLMSSTGQPLRGGTLYALSRVGRVIVITNYKNQSGDVGSTPPRFVKEPMDRLRDAQA